MNKSLGRYFRIPMAANSDFVSTTESHGEGLRGRGNMPTGPSLGQARGWLQPVKTMDHLSGLLTSLEKGRRSQLGRVLWRFVREMVMVDAPSGLEV
jgi:hypothetical protein